MKLRATMRALEQIRQTRTTLVEHDLRDLLILYDASQFCVMYAADLTILTRDMMCKSEWWESRLYARLLAMTMLECAEDLPTVLGHKFRKSLEAVARDEHRQRLSGITRQLSGFRKRHESELKNIRHIAAAHRDHDPNRLMGVIDALDTSRLLAMGRELHDLETQFSLAMADVFFGINPVREVLKNSRKPLPERD